MNVDLLGAVIIALAPVSLYVAVRYVRAAVQRPHIDFLTTSAVREALVAAAMLLFAIVGLNVLWRGLTSFLLLPAGWAVILIAIGVLLIAIGSLIKLIALIRWDRQARRGNRRAGDDAVREQAAQVRREP